MIPIPKAGADMVALRRYLMEVGVDFQTPTNEWEVIRYRRNGSCGIVYRNAKGRITLTGDAEKMWHALKSGRPATDPLPEQNAPRRRVQLYTDASSYHETKAGSWAAVLVLPDDAEHEAHGPLKGDIKSSTSAEARAVANGLHHFIRLGLILARDHVTVICDNQAVAKRVTAKGKSKSPDVQEALDLIHKLQSGAGIKIVGEWIRGHQPESAIRADPRVRFNRRCDELCGQHSKALHRERSPSRATRTHEARTIGVSGFIAAAPEIACDTHQRKAPDPNRRAEGLSQLLVADASGEAATPLTEPPLHSQDTRAHTDLADAGSGVFGDAT